MTFEIVPRVGLVGLPFGSSRQQVRQFFGGEPQEFRRTPAANPSDHWPAIAAFAYFDDGEQLEAVEFASPAQVRLNGRELLSLTGTLAADVLRAVDENIRVEADGLTSGDLGVSLWTDEPPTSAAAVQSVLVFKDGYLA